MLRCQVDDLIAGGGPAGLTIARLLALRGRLVLVVDPGRGPPDRLELIAPATLGTIANLGLLPMLGDPGLAEPCLGIRRHGDGCEPEHEDFLRHPYRSGYVVERATFDARLRTAAVDAGACFLTGRINDVDLARGTASVRADDGSVQAVGFSSAAIDATGRAAMVARRSGARIAMRDRMIAERVGDTIDAGRADGPGWLDFARSDGGWSYRIRGPNGRVQSWRIRRAGAGERRAGACRVDASSAVLTEAAGPGWIAIGDAAAAFDPITSQGLGNALSSALVAAGMILSGAAADPERAQLYASAVRMTHARSEAGRAGVYGAMRSLAVADPAFPVSAFVGPARA